MLVLQKVLNLKIYPRMVVEIWSHVVSTFSQKNEGKALEEIIAGGLLCVLCPIYPNFLDHFCGGMVGNVVCQSLLRQ